MVKLIAEIGINHGGDLDNAIKLINNSKDAGVWGVKFQYRSDNFFADNHEMGSTLIKSELERSTLEGSWIPLLYKKAKENDLNIGFSFFKRSDLMEFYDRGYQTDFIKIPSAEFRNIKLIELAKSKNIPVMASYGGGSEEEVEKYIKLANFDENDCIFHCIANYPIATGNQQLSFIERMKKMTKAKIGYSSHDSEWEIVLLSLQYNIDFIERHICISKDDLGLDISTSSDALEFKKLNNILNKYTDIISSPPRVVNQGEILNIRNLGTGLYFDKAYKAKDTILIQDLIEKSPATGLRVNELDGVRKFEVHQNVKLGEPLLDSHIRGLDIISQEIKDFREKNKISLPVRLHDYVDIKKRFEGSFFEMHLSYEEVFELRSNINLLDTFIDKGDHVSIHLPDYISNDNLIDPFSDIAHVKEMSLKIINICIDVSKYITNISMKPTLILGSFSMRNGSKDDFYKIFKEYCENIKNNHNVNLYAQWLPKKAWYFGGTAILDQFCSKDDIRYILSNDIKMCLDFSHLILSANYFQEDWYEWFKLLENQIEHIHISDAEGDDGEGVDFGKGDLDHHAEIIGNSKIKVLEVWEGHHNVGEKFYSALKFLKDLEKK